MQSIQTAIRRCVIHHDNFDFQWTIQQRIDTATQQLASVIIDDDHITIMEGCYLCQNAPPRSWFFEILEFQLSYIYRPSPL